MKRLLKKALPKGVVGAYHRLLAFLAAFRYGFPSEKMIVIGVTGTNGKSTTCNLIAKIFEEAGHRVGVTSTVNFKIAEKEWLNDTKMTMLGRFRLQKLLADMVRAGCTYAVVETSSEGLAQYRGAAINYDVAVFTNLTPEHIESHGSFEKYKNAKALLFSGLMKKRSKRIGGNDIKKTIVANIADPHGGFFLGFTANKKYGYLTESIADAASVAARHVEWPLAIVKALRLELSMASSRFTVRDVPFEMKLLGRFNVENALAAISVGLSQGVEIAVMAKALGKIAGVPGRLEFIDEGQSFSVLVDYAPEPESFRKLYDVVHMREKKGRIIHILGSCGGGRDADRRPVLGRLAAENADIVIVTNEDPYDDDPAAIIADVAAGAAEAGKKNGENLFSIIDRGEAIEKAVQIAAADDLVIITGKGAEQAIVVADGKKIPWDDRLRMREAIAKRLKNA